MRHEHMPGLSNRMDFRICKRERGALPVWLPHSAFVMGLIMAVVWGCGSDQPSAPAAATSMNPSRSSQSSSRNGGGVSYDPTGQSTEYSERSDRLSTFQQQIRNADSDSRQDVLVNGIYSDDPAIKIMALDGLAPMLSWNAQAKSEVERVLQFESDPGVRAYMEDLLAKQTSPELLQATSAGAAKN